MGIPKVRFQFKSVFMLLLALLLVFGIQPVLAQAGQMHIMEGFLPLSWCIFWWCCGHSLLGDWLHSSSQVNCRKNLGSVSCWVWLVVLFLC